MAGPIAGSHSGGSNLAGSDPRASIGQEAMTQVGQRERYWEESTPEDKIERLRDEVARLCALVTQQSKIIVSLGMHAHGVDGKLMVPMVDSLHENRALGQFAHDGGIPHRLRKPHERR